MDIILPEVILNIVAQLLMLGEEEQNAVKDIFACWLVLITVDLQAVDTITEPIDFKVYLIKFFCKQLV